MKVLVLGAGVVGATTAHYLNRLGCEVWVLDRATAPAAETSYANGGQVAVSHAEPWANPGAPLKILKWLARADAPLRFRPRADLRQWLWGLAFLAECLPSRTRRNIEQLVRLGIYSRAKLEELRTQTGIEYDALQKGILHFYTDPREFEASHEPARLMRELGCDRQTVTPDEAVRIEPALAAAKDRLAGATYTPGDESGDAHKFTVELAKVAARNGVRFVFNQTITALRVEKQKISHIEAVNCEGRFVRLKADAYVLALGAFSPLLAAPLGIRLAVYPAKGYSVTLPIKDSSKAYSVSLTDDEYKLVFSRLGERLRIAGTAELAGYDRSLDVGRCAAIVQRVQSLFPGAAEARGARYWAGLRPATPSNVPCIGKTFLENLYLNTGHGTLGWTLACGSGAALADLVCGRKPEVDFDFVQSAAHEPAARAAAHRLPRGS